MNVLSASKKDAYQSMIMNVLGRPSTGTTTENVTKVREAVLED
jgi:hypothetical protein